MKGKVFPVYLIECLDFFPVNKFNEEKGNHITNFLESSNC
jgi:hypothetical protein